MEPSTTPVGSAVGSSESTSSSGSCRPKRKSEPPRPARPEIRHRESWEFPLSREEKKHRVMCLFEQELAEARRSGEEQVLEELQCQLERIEELQPGTAKRLKDAVAGLSGAPEQTEPAEAEEVAAPPERGPTSPRTPLLALIAFLAFSLLALAAGTVAAFVWIRQGPAQASVDVAESCPGPGPAHSPELMPMGSPEGAAPPATISLTQTGQPSGLTSDTTATTTEVVAIASTSDRVMRLYHLGQANLKKSDCYQAQYYFSQSLNLLEQVDFEPSAGVSRDWVTALLLGNLAFSLICAQRFDEGVALLQGCLTGELDCASHFLNALGFGLFQMKDYSAASMGFFLGAEKDPMNPIIWNNLGATRMVLRDLEGADEAMLRVADLADFDGDGKGIALSEHHKQVIMGNAAELQHRFNTGKVRALPRVELWFGDGDGDGERGSRSSSG